jgi:hypothetical protein
MSQPAPRLALRDRAEGVHRFGNLLGEMGDIVLHGRQILFEASGVPVVGRACAASFAVSFISASAISIRVK